ncbi:hypothetical protein P3X46_004640 [Hevea brasiliensis]|uniref:HAT C-terminal dimerisation domain-containing protein n=1 Tax=Hevea brasiliensis TaxID=3981 RepID=A0ABQ9N079_HEVBR|nr:hypothetical protein P3X46_004640 [Hevea brasiliensis]
MLSQTTSTSICERNWSTFSLINTETRNKLRYQKLHVLTFVHYNIRLKLERRYNPIHLDYIFEEDNPLNPWLEERESPLLDGESNSWLENDDDVNAPSQYIAQN